MTGLSDDKQLEQMRRGFEQDLVRVGPATASTSLTAEQQVELDHAYGYKAPTPEQIPKYEAINQAAKNFERVVLENCPSSADRTFATRQIRDARMTANRSIALAR